jgi:quercetin dioxygenase-like cupin family protein
MSSAVNDQVIRAGQGETSTLGGIRNNFLLSSADTGGRFALVVHTFEPRALAAPMHRHAHEDEWSYVLSGRIGAIVEGVEVEGGPGDLLLKPRGRWHTFWNAGDDEARCLELIGPAGLEEMFLSFGGKTAAPDPDQLAAIAARYGCDLDFPATGPVVERHGLRF